MSPSPPATADHFAGNAYTLTGKGMRVALFIHRRILVTFSLTKFRYNIIYPSKNTQFGSAVCDTPQGACFANYLCWTDTVLCAVNCWGVDNLPNNSLYRYSVDEIILLSMWRNLQCKIWPTKGKGGGTTTYFTDNL